MVGSTRDRAANEFLFTYIGRLKNDEEGKQQCDYVIAGDSYEIGSLHAVIRYDVIMGAYTICDLKTASGTFCKIQKPIAIKESCMVMFVGHSFVITPKTKDQDIIDVRFIQGPMNRSEFRFQASQAPIRIGRLEDCNVCIDDNTISRVQCTINFCDDTWTIVDSDGQNTTTNGTWLYIGSPMKIETGMILKLGPNILRAQVFEEGDEELPPSGNFELESDHALHKKCNLF